MRWRRAQGPFQDVWIRRPGLVTRCLASPGQTRRAFNRQNQNHHNHHTWCANGAVPTGVNLKLFAGEGSLIPWHCDNERLFGHPSCEPKVIVSMSLGHSDLFKLRPRPPWSSPSSTRLDHGDLLVKDILTQFEYMHSAESELSGPRVNLTFRWKTQHMTCCMVLLVVMGACHLWKYAFTTHEGVCCRDHCRGSCPERRLLSRGRARWIGHPRCRSPRRYLLSLPEKRGEKQKRFAICMVLSYY